jgi:hypothetical protein
LCVNRLRPQNSICYQGFELANGLSFLATDTTIHELLDHHTIDESQQAQVALGKIRNAAGHYKGQKLLAIDPHRIITYSRRMMSKKKRNQKNHHRKFFKPFFVLMP